jgi:hypothetical protein
MKEIKLKNGFILKKGNFYLWSGYNEGLNEYWKNTLCKILNISETDVVIFDIFANKEYEWRIDSLNKSCSFKKLFLARAYEWAKKVIK